MNKTTAIREVLTASLATDGEAGEYQLAPDAVLAIVWDGSSRLIDVGGNCYGLPAVSTLMLASTLREGVDGAVARVALLCAVRPERVRADLTVFLANLARQGLLTRPTHRGNRLNWLHRLKVWPFAAVMKRLLRESPSDVLPARALLIGAYACLKALGWAQTIKLWQETMATWPQAAEGAADPMRVKAIRQAVRDAISQSLFPVDCKARALCCWAMLRSAGQWARLVVGIDLFPFLGHCWCESASRGRDDDQDRSGRFTPVLDYT
jgi:Transglutaminase-like superfamily